MSEVSPGTTDVGNTVPISAVSLPLPTGAATETTLSSVDGKLNSLGQKTMANSTPIVIASDQTSVPTSTGLPTFLSSTYGFAIGINQPTASTDNPLLYLRNPNGSGKNLYVKFCSYGIAVANVLGTIRLYKNPTVSANGTAQTIVSFGGGTTVALLTSVPTVTSNGTLLHTGVTGQNSLSLNIPLDFELTIAPNESLLLTGSPGSNSRQAEISLRWIEV